MILGGDIGGTKTNLAFFDFDNNKIKIIQEKKYVSKDYDSLDKIVQDFIQSQHQKVSKACFGVAGPVKNNEVKTTNLPWDVKADALSHLFCGAPVTLINDLEANAWGIDALEEKEFFTLQKGNEKISGNRALISAGTGLGEAGAFFDGKKHTPFASEGGHADFAPQTEKEIALLNYLSNLYEHVSYERVLSGEGLHNIYQFLIAYHNKKPCSEIKDELEKNDPAAVISKHALNQSDPLCQEALDMLITFYGAEAGNCALRYMAYGGVYIGGGMAPKILDRLKTPLFIEAFLKKGRLKELMKSFTVKVILNEKTALLGAGLCAKNTQ